MPDAVELRLAVVAVEMLLETDAVIVETGLTVRRPILLLDSVK